MPGEQIEYPSIVISGTGGSKEPFHKIADPMMFRRRVPEQIAAMEERRDTRKEEGYAVSNAVDYAKFRSRSQ